MPDTPPSAGNQPTTDPSATKQTPDWGLVDRLKKQRDEARREATDMRNEMQQLRSQVEMINQKLTGPVKNGNGNPEDVSMEDLYRYATNEEYATQKPHMAMTAALNYAKKLVNQEKDKIRQDVLNEVLGTIQQKEDDKAIYQSIVNDFGVNALDQDSDLFQLADKKYRLLQQRYGAKEVDQKPAFKKLVFSEAYKELGLDRPKEPSAPQNSALKPKAPPPEAQLEGAGEGMVDLMAKSRSALDKGDWQGSLGLKVHNIWNE